MSDQVNVGDYSLEISGDEVVVRDESGAIVETVDLDDVNGELTLPDGQTVDLASILADAGVENFQTAAGPANDNLGSINGGPGNFTPFHGTTDEFGGLDSEGALGGTSLGYDDPGTDDKRSYDPAEAPVPVTWSSHDPWRIDENQGSVSFGKVITGNPADFKFEVSDDRFEIVDGVLQLRDGVSFDYETEAGIDLEITATSRTGDVKTIPVHIDVTDVNEAQTGFIVDANAANENVAGAVIGKLTVADPDKGDQQSFQVSDSRFEVVDGQLKLKDGVSLDHESEPLISVTITATDQGGHQIQRTVTIQVGDVNEGQTSLSLIGDSIAENTPGAVVGTVIAADPDAGDSQSFQVSDSRFEVVDGQLKLKDGVSLDHESEPTVNVVVTATDSVGHQIQQVFAITVGDVNEAQTALSLDNTAVAENAAGAVVGTLTVADPDAGDSQSFQVSDSRFEMVDGQLKLKDGVSLDHESEPSVNVTVTATDSAGHQVQQTFAINVGDVNETPTDIDLSGNAVVENVAGAVIGALSAIDPDAGDSHSFEVSDSRFEVVNGQLKLKDGVSLDFESEPNLNVTVIATDSAGNKVQETFSLSVGDVNEAQTALSLDHNQILENAPGAVVGMLAVADPDAGDVQSFQVSDSRFEVVDGQLKLKDGVSLDHESEPSVDVTVTATDKGGHQIQQTFTVGIGDVNEAPLSLALVTDSSQLLVNGSFEANKLNNGQWQLFNGITGWKTNSQVEIQNNVTNKASDGAQVVEMDADKAVDVVYQDVKTTAGHIYELTFDTATRKDTKGTDAVDVYWNGAKIGTVDPQSTTWSTSSFQVIGTGGNDRLEFREVGGENDNYGGLLDNVSLKGMGTTVAENVSGVVIGTLQVTDPDVGDSHSFEVSDSRFEVVDGQLKLKADASLDYEAEQSVNVTVTATDSGGQSVQQTFVINVANVNEAPSVMSTDGTVVNHIVDTSTAYNPVANATVGAYLYSNDSAGVAKPASSLLNGVDASNMTLSAETPVTVTFQKEAAGNRNMIGTYQYDNAGNIIAGSVKFVWLDATAGTEGKLGASMSKDFLGYSQASTISLGTMPAGTHVGFFTVSNGASDNGNKTLLTSAAAGTSNQTDAMAAIASKLSIQVDANGNGRVFVGSSQMNGGVFFTHNKSLNTDFNGSADIDHMASGVSSSLPGQLLIGVEDLSGGGDKDFNDVVFSVDLGTYNVNKMTQSSLQPTVDFSDVDSDSLAQAVIHTTGFQSGDALNVPPSGDFNVTVSQSGADYTITIVGKTGSETLDQYEDFANSIYFSTSSKTEGERHIGYTVTDSGGLTSTVSSADIGVANSYEISSSQLANGQNALGSGDDLLHVNTSSLGATNMGDGYDTVHLAKQGASFGHNEAVNLQNVEAIDTTGYGANKVSLSIDDVLNMTDGDNRLTIVGETGDSVTLTANGSNHWTVVESNAQFTTYAYSDPSMQAVVEISNQLNAQVS